MLFKLNNSKFFMLKNKKNKKQHILIIIFLYFTFFNNTYIWLIKIMNIKLFIIISSYLLIYKLNNLHVWKISNTKNTLNNFKYFLLYKWEHKIINNNLLFFLNINKISNVYKEKIPTIHFIKCITYALTIMILLSKDLT